MAKIIASTYEIIKQIGSGGGGNVYLANHIRLGKLVVLKADKRRTTTRPELLRREVDILKELRHSYIPQVYDYFVENDITYTVMDFIEGESLDRPLKRGEQFSQPQVIKWAKQILEALAYLHSPIHGKPPKGYVHSDIKPANLMRMPNDDVCLIDFNIALALGEENIVGHSEGYASPEHYGLDYTAIGQEQTSPEADTAEMENTEPTEILTEETETIDGENETILLSELYRKRSDTSARKIVPDVRSDIYSVGATLYHLLSGKRPEKLADQVKPLSENKFSPQIVKIISKAMNPNPDLRYQTAEDMLWDFNSLRENDPRTKQWKRENKIIFSILSVVLLAGVGLAFTGLKRMQVTEHNQKLAEYSENAMEEGDIDSAIRYAFEAIPEKKNIVTPGTSPEAQKALAEALGVYDLEDGFKKSGVVKLEKNPLYLTVSPNGETAACMCEEEVTIIDSQTLDKRAVLPAVGSAMAEIEFLDDKTVIYAGERGLCAYDTLTNTELWRGEMATAISVSGDGSTVAAVYKDEEHAVIYNSSTGEKVNEIDFSGRRQQASMVSDSFANPYGNLFELSADGSRLAVSFEDGSLDVFNTQSHGNKMAVLEKGSGYTYFNGAFNGKYLAFSASGGNSSIFAVIDAEQEKQTVGLKSESRFCTEADETGIYVQIKNILVKIDPVTGEQTPLVNTEEIIDRFSVGTRYTSISTEDEIQIFDAEANIVTRIENSGKTGLLQSVGDFVLSGRIDTPEICLMKYEDNSQEEIARYDPLFDHDEARISADGESIMLFSYKQFRICTLDGSVMAELELPDPEKVYDQQFIRDGEDSYLEVTYNDGRILSYSAKDGKLISELDGEAPDVALDEEFYTDDFRIEAALHEKPQVYDIKTGDKICELREDAFLTYVTQTEENIVIQYVTAEGFRYGVLLDGKCREIARLPYLSDVKDDKLYFDYPSVGSMRKSDIYNLDSLIEQAEVRIEGSK